MTASFKESLEYSRDNPYLCPQCGSPAEDILDIYDYEENYEGCDVIPMITLEHALLMEVVIEEAETLGAWNYDAFIALNNSLVKLNDYREEHYDNE